jgi:uncharacterized caspase-like protein
VLKSAIAALLLTALCATAQAPLDIRIALVIGNAAYTHISPLDNSGNDATVIAGALRGLGFTVEELHDASKDEMATALERVLKQLRGQQGLAMLYYAGHGVQLDWHNYLLPIDVHLARASELQQQAVDVAVIVESFKKAGTRMSIVVIDACRDNPFAPSEKSNKGLAPMDAPPGTFLAYATQPGNTAEDGEAGSSNGPYAQFLQLELRRPFAKVEDVFKRVRYQVRQLTQGRQIPWESTSLEEDFVFNDGSHGVTSSEELERLLQQARRYEQELSSQANIARERERLSAVEIERVRLASISAAQSQVAAEVERRLLDIKRQQEEASARDAATTLERERLLALELADRRERQVALAQAFAAALEEAQRRQRLADQLAEYDKERNLARVVNEHEKEKLFAAEKTEWDAIRDSKTASEVYAYLDKYPNGFISELAQSKIEQLEVAKIQPAPDQSGLVQPFEAKRFRRGDSYQFVVRDLLTKIELNRPTFTTTKADAQTAEFNQGYRVTQSGAIIQTIAGATLDPYQQWIPSGEYQIGKKWHTRSVMTPKGGRPIWVELNGKVVAREMISVPAGIFDVYKMEMEQIAEDGTRLNITYWGQSDWGVAVKQVREIRDRAGRLSGEIYELLSRKRGT